jgi:predicted RNA-binding protein with PIN domain
MAYLIDGNNLLGHLFPGAHRDPENRLKLVRRLIAFQRFTRARVILVFDGPPSADIEAMIGDAPRFAILNPPPGGSADTILEEFIASRKDTRRLFVVSTDRSVRAVAREHGAISLVAREFAAELNGVLREHRNARELDKKEPGPSKLEVKLWSELFGEKKRN